MTRAREAYQRRELTYPIDFALDMTSAVMSQDPQHALQQFCTWVKAKYELTWNPQALPSADPAQLRALLIAEAEKWDESRIAERAERAVAAGSSPDELDEWFDRHCNAKLTEDERKRAEDDPQTVAEEKIASVLRSELTQFERWVLLQILDSAWKDHLYSMDQIKESIGFRSFSQRDPRIEFKREAGRLFEEMGQSVRDKVTDLIFKARLTPQVAARQPSPAGPAQHGMPPRPAQPAIAAAAAAATAAGTAPQRRDLVAAQRAGPATAPARPKRQPIRRTAPA
ncbi:MAG: hypothetical protein IH830_14375, partial [Planctomycetes bacterium]|nr:hypothetical protein [Planctomycetota bacterium]